jgi:hypothetical protein
LPDGIVLYLMTHDFCCLIMGDVGVFFDEIMYGEFFDVIVFDPVEKKRGVHWY